MPTDYLRHLTAATRTVWADRHLARYLAFIAGAANAGGFLAVHQYTSHMSGLVSASADDLVVGRVRWAFHGLAAVTSFLLGAAITTLLIRWAKAHELRSRYALPLVTEACLLTLFGFLGANFGGGKELGIITLLCFTMGLQNAMITKLSGSVIRTTHLTGMVTDIGISMGRLAFSPSRATVNVSDELAVIRLLGSLIFMFFAGGVIGAFGFKHIGFLFTLPLSFLLVVLSLVPVMDDLRTFRAGTGG